jgi:Zn-dependent protease
LSGPGAGFLLLALVVLATFLFTGLNPFEQAQWVAYEFGLTKLPNNIGPRLEAAFAGQFGNFAANAYFYLVQINLLWGLVNLLPMWPLDGGQATQIFLVHLDRSRGQRWTHVVSLLVAGVLAMLAYTWTSPPELGRALFFAFFALINFQVLQTIHQAQTMGLYQEDEWWRR